MLMRNTKICFQKEKWKLWDKKIMKMKVAQG